MPRTLRRFNLIFLCAGLVLATIAGGMVIRSLRLISNGSSVRGTVIANLGRDSEGSTVYYPRVRFINGEGQAIVFDSRTGTSPARYRVGDQLTVLYNPQDPTSLDINDFSDLWLAPVILGGMSTIFTGVPVGILVYSSRKKKQRMWLQQFGQLISAKVTSVAFNTSLAVNDVHPYQIIAQWVDETTHSVYVFKSENLWFDPTEWVTETINVWIDPRNPRRYAVDTGFLPKLK